jgi:hypothetical protein
MKVETIKSKPTFEQRLYHEREQAAGSGISDYIRAARHLGYDALISTLERMDDGERIGRNNPHCAATERIRLLGMPVQEYIGLPVSKFLGSPQDHLAMLPEGDYYFASIVPGVHLAHGNSPEEVVAFVENYVQSHPEQEAMSQELYISHNGEPAISAHIVVRDTPGANADYIEATIGNFNAFHRGTHSPEIIARRRLYSYEWEFRDSLATDTGWRDTTEYSCRGDINLTRPEIATQLYRALQDIPHDDTHFLPGYYEVLFERTSDYRLRPAFIEAVVD